MAFSIEADVHQFYDDIIRGQNDISCEKWKLVPDIFKNFEDVTKQIKLVNPMRYLVYVIKKCNSNDPNEIYKCIEKIQKSLNCLMLYCINIIRNPKKSEFQIIKRYTGYYKFNIDTVMEGLETEVFNYMGYRLDEENDQFFLQINDNLSQVELAYQLYLSQVYCANVCTVFKRLFEIAPVNNVIVYFINNSNNPNAFQKYLNSSENDLNSKKEQQFKGQFKYEENNKSEQRQLTRYTSSRSTTV
ncbi:uncharacterized protein LOC136092356 [Hydra vulgaris]|uniref:Uncharacterized protein LOC136092356 n=1 Tax=Hydra vulgaris TaxID=6087 RepID=A0ABM4DPH9_HYDVU